MSTTEINAYRSAQRRARETERQSGRNRKRVMRQTADESFRVFMARFK